MTPSSSNSQPPECDMENSTTCRLGFTLQTSQKRPNSDDNQQNHVEALSSKRGCVTENQSVACPLAEYGCASSISYDRLLDHYASELHQKTLMKAIEVFVRQLHSESHNGTTDSNSIQTKHSEILEILNTFAEGVSCLNDDNAQLYAKFVQLQSTTIEQQKHIVRLHRSVEETSQICNAFQTNNQILQTEIESVKQTLTDASSLASHDGSYIWKILNVAEHLADAIAEKQTSIYSPPFYSSPTGYKFCMRLYLFGDGNARRTHVSLFFVIMRGDYDPILIWPFQHKVTFSLYDQTGDQRHIIDSFRPDIKSNSFQRPRSSMNIASGVPKFAPLSIIQQENSSYVRDNCMFIRCLVDFESLPKSCIPYKINLNPALPLNVQQRMMKTEIERQRKLVITEPSDEPVK